MLSSDVLGDFPYPSKKVIPNRVKLRVRDLRGAQSIHGAVKDGGELMVVLKIGMQSF